MKLRYKLWLKIKTINYFIQVTTEILHCFLPVNVFKSSWYFLNFLRQLTFLKVNIQFVENVNALDRYFWKNIVNYLTSTN
jgi:hypothetical protein